MSKDWDKLAGEEGERVTSSRFGRMWKLGKMGAKVTASMLANRASNLLSSEEDQAERNDETRKRNAKHVAEVLGQLKGASMKVGQLMSADPELSPEGFGEILSTLQSEAPPMTYRTVKEQIERNLDRPIEVVFRDFDPEPIGAASIGQVHRATLDTGETVAVKVQYPGVMDALDSDIRTITNLLGYGRAMVDKKRLDEYAAEIRDLLLTEADYIREAEAIASFGPVLASREGIRAPRAFPEWTSKEVLTMEYIEGTKLDVALEHMDEERRTRILERWVSLYAWMVHERFDLHADPHPGNFLLDAHDDIIVLDFGSVRTFDAGFGDDLLDLLDTCWQRQPERAIPIYESMGFGDDDFDPRDLNPNDLYEYHEIILAPFLTDSAFDFGSWTPGAEGREFMMSHPTMLKLVPPASALPYFRTLSGIKGLLARFDAKINVFQLTYETAKRRGRLTGEPLV
ncbi:MAG: AarF/ABC1/UbiB kinase family protein [Myxococcota bacterium]